MEMSSLRSNLSTITDIVFFCGTAIDVRSFFSRNIHFFLRLCSLTIHVSLLIARGQRAFFFCDGLKCCWHTVISAQCSECQRGEKFKTSADQRQGQPWISLKGSHRLQHTPHHNTTHQHTHTTPQAHPRHRHTPQHLYNLFLRDASNTHRYALDWLFDRFFYQTSTRSHFDLR